MVETAIRPVSLSALTVSTMLEGYGRDEGAALAKVAMQHLFRIYLELRLSCPLTLLRRMREVSAAVMVPDMSI
jgi:hypothetical protein